MVDALVRYQSLMALTYNTFPMIVACAVCLTVLDESPDITAEITDPCPKCGSTLRLIREEPPKTDTHRIRVKFKDRHTLGKKPHRIGKTRADWSRDLGRYVRREMLIDRENDIYEEWVIDPETGSVIYHCREPLSKHLGHGSDISKPD